MAVINVDSRQQEELINITTQVQQIVSDNQVGEGLCHLWCLHTTAGIIVNENADPDVPRDLLLGLSRVVSDTWPYRHAEGNSPAHLKSTLTGCEITIPIRGGKLALGIWQGIFFAEFDGPRNGRKVEVSVIRG